MSGGKTRREIEEDARAKEEAGWFPINVILRQEALAHGLDFISDNTSKEWAERERGRKLTILSRIMSSFNEIVKDLLAFLEVPAGPIEAMDPKKKRKLFLAYKVYLEPDVRPGNLIAFESEYDATQAKNLNQKIIELQPRVEEKQRRAAEHEEAVRRIMAEAQERERAVVAAVKAFNSKVAGEAAAHANAEMAREAAVKEQAEAALVGDRWKLAIIKDMDPEEKLHFAVALLHKQTPGIPVYPLYDVVDKIEPGEIDKYIERLRNELSPRVAPRGGPANLKSRITNSMLGGTRKQKKRRSCKRKTR